MSTLMGPGSDVWMAAVRAASELTLEELTGSLEDAWPASLKTSKFRTRALLMFARPCGGRGA